jgi:hypothetical protein
MINRICVICTEYSSDTWTLVITDNKDKKHEISGHKSCIDDVESKIKNLKNLHKLSIDQILKEINIK